MSHLYTLAYTTEPALPFSVQKSYVFAISECRFQQLHDILSASANIDWEESHSYRFVYLLYERLLHSYYYYDRYTLLLHYIVVLNGLN